MVEYPTFESWFHEIEFTAFRSERFFDRLNLIQQNPQQRNEFITNWMRAAFESGRTYEDKYL
jgi:hypothetical protein